MQRGRTCAANIQRDIVRVFPGNFDWRYDVSGSGGGTWIDQPGDSCATLSQQTTWNSPDRTVLSQITKGTLLDVSVNKTGKAVVIEALWVGQVA